VALQEPVFGPKMLFFNDFMKTGLHTTGPTIKVMLVMPSMAYCRLTKTMYFDKYQLTKVRVETKDPSSPYGARRKEIAILGAGDMILWGANESIHLYDLNLEYFEDIAFICTTYNCAPAGPARRAGLHQRRASVPELCTPRMKKDISKYMPIKDMGRSVQVRVAGMGLVVYPKALPIPRPSSASPPPRPTKFDDAFSSMTAPVPKPLSCVSNPILSGILQPKPVKNRLLNNGIMQPPVSPQISNRYQYNGPVGEQYPSNTSAPTYDNDSLEVLPSGLTPEEILLFRDAGRVLRGQKQLQGQVAIQGPDQMQCTPQVSGSVTLNPQQNDVCQADSYVFLPSQKSGRLRTAHEVH
jgi:hypothetical protein